MNVDRQRLERSIEELGRIGQTPRGGLTRLALSDDDKRGRDWMVTRMREAGLAVTVDQMGNIFGQRPGTAPLPPVMMGSHVDSVPTGGRYDGQLGVLCGLEVIRTLNDQKIRTRHPVTLAIFTNEEGARFQPALLVAAGTDSLPPILRVRNRQEIAPGNANLPSSCRHAGTNSRFSGVELLNYGDLRERKSWHNPCVERAAKWMQWPSPSGWQ